MIAKPVNQTTQLDNVNKAHLNVDEKWISPAGYLGTKLRPRKELNSNDVRAEWEEEPAKTRHSGSKFNSGDRVIHRKFGLGVVKHADGDKLEILFDKVGRKKVIDRFIESE